MKKTMEYLSGGFAFLLIDKSIEKLFSVCSHNPLWSGYVKGYGMIFSSMKNGILETISALKNTTIEKNNICVWEDYYCRQMPENSISEIDLDSGMINEYEFQPRYFHPNWDPYHREDKGNNKVLVSASGGLDSSTTLSVLKAAELDITAVHFHYGHRGEDAEWCAVQNICDILDIPLTSFDISKNMELLDSSMLTDSKHKITTGTENDLKTTIAWTCVRNVFFVTYMGALAESLIIKDYDNVYITGGFMNLTESGVYPDNSERFIETFDKFITLGSIVGSRIKSLYGLANILKTEQYILLDALGLLDTLSPWLISCDRPIVKKGIPYNCSKDGKPACGSGGLSYWACNRAGFEDKRKYYEVDDKEYKLYTPPSNIKRSLTSISEIIDKIQIPENNKKILRRKVL